MWKIVTAFLVSGMLYSLAFVIEAYAIYLLYKLFP